MSNSGSPTELNTIQEGERWRVGVGGILLKIAEWCTNWTGRQRFEVVALPSRLASPHRQVSDTGQFSKPLEDQKEPRSSASLSGIAQDL